MQTITKGFVDQLADRRRYPKDATNGISYTDELGGVREEGKDFGDR